MERQKNVYKQLIGIFHIDNVMYTVGTDPMAASALLQLQN